MKPLCGRTIKGVIAWVSFIGFAGLIVQLLRSLKSFNNNCADGESECTKRLWMIVGICLWGYLFLCMAIVLIRRRLVGRF